MQQKEYDESVSRHILRPSFIKVTYWKMKPSSEGHDRYKIAPKLFEKRRYKATFGGSRSLELADKSKIIEAFAHNDL